MQRCHNGFIISTFRFYSTF